MGRSVNIFILEDDDLVSGVLVRVATRWGRPVLARTVTEGYQLLGTAGPYAAFVIDVGLPDGNGMHVLAAARITHPWTPALVATGILSDAIASAAFTLRALCTAKPVSPSELSQFLEDAVTDPIALTVQERAKRTGMPPAATDVYMRAAVDDASREEIAKARGGSPLTVRDHEDAVREKLGVDKFDRAVKDALREAARRRR
jgi:DNA-binding NtrC family response regulator